MVLRIEDLDPARCRPAYTAQLVEDLVWLGLDWDEGGNIPGWRQSERSDYYAECFARLQNLGLVYPCYCTRNELHDASAPHLSDGTVLYSGRCRNLTETQRKEAETRRRPAWRLTVPDETIRFADGLQGEYEEHLPSRCGDFILRRSDGVYAYQLAVVADDAAMGVTQVVRGQDLLSSTPRQLLLYRLLGFEAPQFCHLPLLMSESGARLSKRDRSLDLGVLRDAGITPEEILGRLGWLAGIWEKPDGATLKELLTAFDPQKLVRQNITVPAGLFAPLLDKAES